MESPIPGTRARARRERSRHDASEPDRGRRRRLAGDEIVGEGWHERKGGPHAEVVALEAAGERARGATVYVTLEPCAHHGATPPCVDALLDAGVARVVAGQLDPNPEHGGGLERLRDAGVDVELADGEPAFRCRQQIEEWRTWVTSRTAVRHLQGRGHARRTRARAGRALGHGRGLAQARPRPPRAVRCRRRRDGDRALGQPATRRTRRPRRSGSRGGSRSAAARCPEGSELELRSGPLPRSSTASPPTASSRCSSRAARRSPRRSSRQGSSTSSSCSSRRGSRATVRDARRVPRAARADADGGAPDRRRRAPAGVSATSPRYGSGVFTGSCASSASSSRRREVGRVERALVVAPRRRPPGTDVGDSVAINGCCLTATASDGGRDRVPRGPGDDRAYDARRLESSDRVNVEPALRAGEELGGHYVQGHVDAVGRIQSVEAGGRGAPRLRRGARRRPALLRREGLDHGRRRLAHRRRARRGRLRRRARPAHARGDDALRRPAARDSRLNLEADVLAKYVERLDRAAEGYDPSVATDLRPPETASPFATIDGGDRGHPLGPVRRRRRRRRPRERGRPHDRGQFVTPEAITFMATHGRGLICLCLTPERCDELELRPMTDHNEAPLGTAFTVSIEAREGVSTGSRRTIARAHDPGRDRSELGAARPRAARATSSRCARSRAASRSGRARRRRPSTSRGSPG